MRRARGVVAIILGIALLLSVAGCASIAQQATKAAVENATGVKVDQTTGKTTITGKDGSQATLSSSENKLPDGLPTDVPTYTGAIKSSAVITTGQGTNYTFVITTGDPAQTVIDWYKQQLTDKGWKIEGTVVTGDGAMVTATKGDKQNAVVTVSKNSDGKMEIASMVGVKQ